MAMMETQSTGAGRFAQLDLSRVPSPCFVVDEVKLRDNLSILKAVSEASGAEILLALKAFSMWSMAPLISDYLAGTCASGLWEAKLARAHYGGKLATYAPAFKPSEFDEIASLSDHVVFNSLAQFDRFHPGLEMAEAGLPLILSIRKARSKNMTRALPVRVSGNRYRNWASCPTPFAACICTHYASRALSHWRAQSRRYGLSLRRKRVRLSG